MNGGLYMENYVRYFVKFFMIVLITGLAFLFVVVIKNNTSINTIKYFVVLFFKILSFIIKNAFINYSFFNFVRFNLIQFILR